MDARGTDGRRPPEHQELILHLKKPARRLCRVELSSLLVGPQLLQKTAGIGAVQDQLSALSCEMQGDRFAAVCDALNVIRIYRLVRYFYKHKICSSEMG